MRLLVCGGRMYGCISDDTPDSLIDQETERATAERLKLYDMLDQMAPDFVITGYAKGADQWADNWACMRNVPHRNYPADWKTHGKAAGPIRNQRMIDHGQPDLVLAFPGGRGTADMIRRARVAGVPVTEVAP
jgi:hypothetical protein